MANIKKFQVWFEKALHEVDITFSLRTSKFMAVLPERLQEVMGEKVMSGETLRGIESQIKRTAELAEAKGGKGRKVVIFSFTYEGKRLDPKGKKWILNDPGIGEDDGALILKLWWHVVMERSYGRGDKRYFTQTTRDRKAGQESYTDNLHVGYWGSYKVIPWTAEREKFFQSLDNSMVQVIQRLIKFAGTSPKKMAQLIDAGQPLLLGKGKTR